MLKTNDEKNNSNDDEPSRPIVARTPAEIQRLKLEKLMKNPDKPVIIPEKPKERGAPVVPDFVRNVMGSSAGAGSGEFHVYRHLRRKEYARQHYMNEKARWEQLESDYHKKIEDNKRKAEEETARKRAKRLKKKKNNKRRGKQPTNRSKSPSPSPSESEEDDDKCEDSTRSEESDKPEDSTEANATKPDDSDKQNDLVKSEEVLCKLKSEDADNVFSKGSKKQSETVEAKEVNVNESGAEKSPKVDTNEKQDVS